MRRIAVDFDGTLVTEAWPQMGTWLPGAVDALKALAAEYDEVVIHTCRVAPVETDEETPRDNLDQLAEIEEMLIHADIPLNVYIWDKPYKPPADVYLDNRAIRFHGDWGETLGRVALLSPPYKVTEIAFTTDPSYTGLAEIRTFDTGATRDTDEGKLDYEGFLSPVVLRRYAEYMHQHRIQKDGTLRDSDNWQKGIPLEAYMKSSWRHFMDWWTEHRDMVLAEGKDDVSLMEDAICALLFNGMGYLHELLTSGTLPEA